MKPEQQRIAIAQACGWKYLWDTEYQGWRGDNPDGGGDAFLPDYPNDLNAMHEVEKMLTAIQCNDYDTYNMHRLREGEINPPANRFKFHATAAQRAEAFLRTIGKWVDE